MATERKKAWGVEYTREGKTIVYVDYFRHNSPEEAIQAIEATSKVPWAEASKYGARVITKDLLVEGRPE